MREKAFLLKKNGECYCSICKRKYLKTRYGHRRHELVNELEPIKQEDILYYTVELIDEKIYVKIHNQDQIVYTIFFDKTGKVKSSNQDELSYWLDLIAENFLYEKYSNQDRFLSFSENECLLINRLFPSVYQDINIARFIRMISNRKISERKADEEKIRKIPYGKINLNVGKRYNKKKVKLCKMREYVIDKEVVFEIIYAIGTVIDAKIDNPKKYRFFISKDLIYNPKGYDLSKIIKDENLISIYEPFQYTEFQKAYPEVKLKEFLESGGNNAARFVLSNNNDIIFELIGKAGLGYIAEMSDKIDINRNGKNLKEIFGLSIKALRALNTLEGSKLLSKNLKGIQELYKKYPAVFQEKLSSAGIRLIEDFERYFRLIENDVIKYFRFISNLKEEEYSYYMDYLDMCCQYKLYPYGKFPKTILTAHDVIMIYGKQKREALNTTRFEVAIRTCEYKNLEYEIDDYKFLIPRTAEDLVKESYKMRNCVKAYINSVANGYCYIVFLRRKRQLASSFVTIEVDKDYHLRQMKGKGNSRVPADIAKLVKQWCDEKGIIEDCHDMRIALQTNIN